MFRFLRCCCDIICPPCPFPNAKLRGWTTRRLPNCPQCPGCPDCPFPFQNTKGYSTSFINNCPRCPKCEDNTCYRAANPGEACQPCVPERFLVTLVGVSTVCACFANACPVTTPFPAHNKSAGGPDGSYCRGPGIGVGSTFPMTEELWGDDGPGCGPPATFLNSGTMGSINIVPFGGVMTINAYSPLGNTVFRGTGPLPCKTAVIIGNEVSGCKTVCIGPAGLDFGEIVESGGGFAIVQPCGC
jgi:hypothetical protein